MAKYLVIWVIRVPWQVNKMVLPSMYRRRWRHVHAFIGRNTIALRVQRFAAGANIICLTYATDWWAVIGPVIHSESKSQANRSSSDHEGLLHTLSTIDTQESKFRVRLVLEILAKLMVGENLSWEFPKVGVWLILEVCLILETRRYIFTSFLLLYSKCNNTRTYVWVTYIAFEWKLLKRRPDG